ncbi:MAG: ATP-dependent DNA helicase, partial [Candidatus Latescibacterota bacterium]
MLDTSFRSLGHLCAWINRAFEPLFAAQDPRYQARFDPLRPYRADGADPACVRRLSLAPVPYHRRAQIAELEAQRLARFIAAALQGATPLNREGPDALLEPMARPGDFLILTRTRKLLPVYARALEAR